MGTIILCLLAAASAALVSGTDLSFVSGTTGTPVVLRCIELLDDSGIFSDDHEMVRRLAYVESRDGEQYTSGSGGIWKVKGTVFDESKNATSLFASVETHFNITWENVTYADLDAPIYSALATRLRLSVFEETSGGGVPSTVDAQFQIWDFVFQGEDAPLIQTEFTTLVDQLPAVILCPGVYRDIVLLIDSTPTISESDFELVKSFMLAVVDHFNVSAAFTRIGIVQFAASTEDTLTLSQGTSSSAVNSAINGMQRLRSSQTLIGAATSRAVSLFTLDQDGRGPNTGVARVIVLLSQTSSVDNVTSSLASATAESVGIIAVGVTSSISMSELATLASGDVSTHVFQATDYTQLNSMASTIEDRTCEEQIPVSSDERISGSLAAGQGMTFAISVGENGTNLTLSVTTGSVSAFYSNSERNPSSVVHDFRMNSVSGAPVVYEFHPSPGQVVLYCTIEDTSTGARSTVVSSFVLDVGSPIIAETTTTASLLSVEATQASSLSDAEIAGIVMACIIFIGGIVIAAIYYWFCRIGPNKGSLLKETAMEFRSISRNSTLQAAPRITETPVVVSRSSIELASEIPDVLPPPDKPLTPFHYTPPSVHSSAESCCTNLNNSVNQLVEQDAEVETRRQLREAVETKDLDAVQTSIAGFRNLHLVDVDGDLIRGERLLSVRECLQGLNYAIAQRDVKLLERNIFVARQKNYEPDLQAQLKKAEVLLVELKKIQGMLLKITNALVENNMKLVESLVFEMRAMTGFDNSTIDRMVDVHRCKEELKVAMMNRDLQLSLDVIDKVESKGYQKELQDNVKQAKKMIKELEYLEKIRTDVLNLSQSKVSEIRSYAKPPPGVQQVMGAVYRVLGYLPYEFQNWVDIQALMGKTGKDSLKRQILNIDPRKIDLQQSQEAKNLIEPFTVESIRDISIGLALFYVFVSSVVEEVEKLNSGQLSAPSPFFYNLAMNVSNS